jgi:hypothetical protein
MNSFTVPPINCSFCSETAIASKGGRQQGKGQVWNAIGYYGSRLNMLASSQLQPVQLKTAPREAVGPGCFQSPKGHQVTCHFTWFWVDEQESLEQWNAFRCHQNGRQLQYDNQTTLCTNHAVLHNTGRSAPFASVLVPRSGSGGVRFMSEVHMTRLPYPPQYLSDKAIEMGRSCKRPAEFAHDLLLLVQASFFILSALSLFKLVSFVVDANSVDVLQHCRLPP